MYKLMIVEDEAFTREGLRKRICWNELEFSEVQVYANGLQALEALDSFSPDLLISDIKMPHMNGIELASEVQKKYPNCHIIFITGYADKEYLLSAIALHVDKFIEKPLDLQEVTDAVEYSASLLRQEIKNTKKLQNDTSDLLPIIQKDILQKILSPNPSWEDWQKIYYNNYFTWSRTDPVSVIYIHVSFTSGKHTILSLLDETIRYFDSKQYCLSQDYFVDQLSPYSVAILMRSDNRSNIHSLINNYQSYLYNQYYITSVVGISRICQALEEIYEYFNVAKQTAEYDFFYNGHSNILDAPARITPNPAPASIFYIKKFNIDGIERIFEALSLNKYSNIDEIRMQLYEYYTLMMERTINDNTLSWDQFKILTLKEYIDLIGYGMKAFQILGNDTYDAKIKNAIHFILWNYKKKDLSIHMIAEHTGLSPNYLCNLFKKQTGSTINDFIVKVRIDKAKVLLDKTDLKLYEIASNVGLQDANYLSTLFKKKCGTTPTSYRQKLHRK